MENNPAVTILICNYNYADYVGEAIQSAYEQTYPNCRLCIVDDASSDNSMEVINKAIEDPPIATVLIPLEKNCGASEARNIGIRACIDTTDYFLILDADDECYADKVERMIEKTVSNPQIGVVYADYHILNTETGNIMYEYKYPFDTPHLHQECIVHSQSLISSNAFRSTQEGDNFYDPALHGPASGSFIGCCEDYDLWLRVAEQFMIVHIPQPLSRVRVTGRNQSTITNVTDEVWQKNVQHIQTKIKQRRNG